MTTRALAIVVLLWLAIAPIASAHEGHTHTVMGTVLTVKAGQVDVKKQDGKTVTIVLTDKTTVMSGKTKASIADLSAGVRVVVDVGDGKSPLTAKAIRLGQKR